MIQPTADDGGTREGPPHPDPGPSAVRGPSSEPGARNRPDVPARAAIDALDRFAPYLGWGLLMAGVLWGSGHAIGRIAPGPATAALAARSVLDALAIALASGLAGWASAVACRLAAAVVLARIERASRADERVDGLALRAIEALERLADVVERRPIAGPPGAPSDHDRVRLLAEIDQAVRSGRPAEAEALLDGFDGRFPGDPAASALRERLAAARREAVEAHLAEIDAARQVNDVDRVLDLYRDAAPALEPDRRGDLERRLAKWFLELIHRRLRGGRIQAEVVHLATRGAEVFGATVEGASLRASLPMLRRSVGLCPRCAQPYVGTANACPQCLATPATAPAAAAEEPESPPDAEPGPVETPQAPDNGPDAGWLRYNEDDEGDRLPPA
jgi:hypothetical protein